MFNTEQRTSITCSYLSRLSGCAFFSRRKDYPRLRQSQYAQAASLYKAFQTQDADRIAEKVLLYA